MAYRAPKAIAEHPGVESCTDGAEDSDYRHDVWLRDGWTFRLGRNAGGRGLFVNSVAEFRDAQPVKT